MFVKRILGQILGQIFWVQIVRDTASMVLFLILTAHWMLFCIFNVNNAVRNTPHIAPFI